MRFLFTISFFLVFTAHLSASHFLGGELTYEWKPNVSSWGDNEYRFTLTLYGDPSGVPLPTSAQIRRFGASGSFNASLIDTAKIYTTCNDTVLVARYQTNYAQISIQGGSTATFYYSQCCRPPNSSNLVSMNDGLNINTTITREQNLVLNSSGHSPVFLSASNLAIQANTTSAISFAADDEDGDSLYYAFTSATQRNGSNAADDLIYAANHSFSSPFDSNTTTFLDPYSGLLTVVNPSAGDYTVAIKVTAYNGQEVTGTVVRDVNVRVVPVINTYTPIVTLGGFNLPQVSTSSKVDSTYFISITEGAYMEIAINGAASYGPGATIPMLELSARASNPLDSAIVGPCADLDCHSLTGNIKDTGSVSGVLSFYANHGFLSTTQDKRYRTILVKNRVTDWCGGERFSYITFVIEITKSSINAQPEEFSMCEGQGKVANIAGQTSNLSWSPTNGVSNPSIANPVLNPITNTIYTVSNLNDSSVATVFVEVVPDTTLIRLSLDSGKLIQNTWLAPLNSNWYYNGLLIGNSKTDFVPTNGAYYTVAFQDLVCITYSDTIEYNHPNESALVSEVFDSLGTLTNMKRIVFEIEGLQQSNVIEHIYYVGQNSAFSSSWDYNIKDMNNNMQVVSIGNQVFEANKQRTRLGVDSLNLPIDSSTRYQITLFNLGGDLGNHAAYREHNMPMLDSKGIYKLNRTEAESTTGLITTNFHLPLVISFRDSVEEVISIPEEVMKTRIEIYPNPNTGLFTLKADEDFRGAKVSIYNLLGTSVYSGRMTGEELLIDLNVSSGVYHAELVNAKGERHVQRLIVR